jgi:O-antigen/teichoic acid export membrane protein
MLFGSEFIESYLPLVFLLPGILVIGPGGILHAYFMGRAYPTSLVLVAIITGALNIALNIIYIPKFGIIGASAITSITLFFWFLSLLFLFYKQSRIPFKDILIFNKADLLYLQNSISRLKSRFI